MDTGCGHDTFFFFLHRRNCKDGDRRIRVTEISWVGYYLR